MNVMHLKMVAALTHGFSIGLTRGEYRFLRRAGLHRGNTFYGRRIVLLPHNWMQQ